MKVIVIYAGNMVHETAFESMDSALDYLTESGWIPECIIEYDGCGCASITDGDYLSDVISDYNFQRDVELANEKAMATGYPR